MDFHRMVIGLMYHFNDRIVLDTEVDFEHAASEMELEYAHISFLLSDAFMVAFVRHEQFDTQDSVASGLSANPANDRKVTTFGLAYYPIHQVAVKADLELWDDATGADWEQFNVGVAFEY